MKNFQLIFFLIIILSSCNKQNYKEINQTLNTNILSDTTIVLTKKYFQNNIHRLSISFSGQLSDTIILQHPNGTKKYIETVLKGKNQSYDGDWYSDSCIVKITNIQKPLKFQIKYQFHSLE